MEEINIKHYGFYTLIDDILGDPPFKAFMHQRFPHADGCYELEWAKRFQNNQAYASGDSKTRKVIEQVFGSKDW